MEITASSDYWCLFLQNLIQPYPEHRWHSQGCSPGVNQCPLELWVAWTPHGHFASWKHLRLERARLTDRKYCTNIIKPAHTCLSGLSCWASACLPVHKVLPLKDAWTARDWKKKLSATVLTLMTGTRWVRIICKAETLTCHCTGASVRRSNAGPFSALCWPPASWPPAELPSVPTREETQIISLLYTENMTIKLTRLQTSVH